MREYFIAAEEVTWNFAPSGRDLLYNRPIPPLYSKTVYPKLHYVEYTDKTFSVPRPQPEWLGILGPIIRAEVGDTVIVHFLNRSKRLLSIHPHGLKYTKENEGAVYSVATGHAAPGVKRGGETTYTWFADETSGPGKDQPSSIMWPYHSHIDESQEVNEGLIGAIIVTAKGMAKPDGSPRDVDQEFVALFMMFDQDFGKETGMMHSINGYIFGNLPGLNIELGSKVRWHVFAMGNERDIHTAHWHGVKTFAPAEHQDVVAVFPATTKTVDMKADNPGSWMFHCHVADHMEGGMMAYFNILGPRPPCPLNFGPGEFWKDPHNVQFTVSNPSNKLIKQINFNTNVFIKPNYLTTTYLLWKSDGPLAAGATATYKFPIAMHDSSAIVGWVVYISSIEYEDGTVWRPKDINQCAHVYWHDGNTQQPRVLPPVQTSHEED
ncbi:MAG TPA: multicopper oxidase domain-containing protein [Candidatus Angelobacter sp.]|nr:multicopper oxidase domain-containing protein [Candidatus Angelobacter sp.]